MLQLAEGEHPVDLWLTGRKPKRVLVLTPYERLDRNLKVLMERYAIDKGNFLVGCYIELKESNKPHVRYYPTTEEWIVLTPDNPYRTVRDRTYKGGARKFLNWYDKQ